jgi:pimeloyl-ACP methyl ester carboxylesterase
MSWTTSAVIATGAVLVCACGSGTPTEKPDLADPTSTPASSDVATSSSAPRDAGTLVLAAGGSVNYWCAGSGTRSVLLEAGTDSGGTDAYPAAFVDPLTEVATVCTYDRPGTGLSDAPPRGRRDMSDLCAVQDEVLAQLPFDKPYLLVGQSGGGNLVIGCAARDPRDVAGLVTIDSYHDDPEVLRAEGFVWHDNPELVDYVGYSEELDRLDLPIGEFPVLVISATDADPGGPKNQRHWLHLSPDSRQVVVEGPHDLQETAPEEVVAEIIADLGH